MTVIFLVLPLAVAVSAAAVAAFVWSTKSGQLDDLDTPPLRMLRDETARRSVTRDE
jgi:cbb3-type cytochrome oxidase maturation protein